MHPLDFPTRKGTVREILKSAGAVTFLNWQPGQKGIIGHRGAPGIIEDPAVPGCIEKGEFAPECTILAFENAYFLGILCSEGDSSVDADQQVWWEHDKNLIGWHRIDMSIEQVSISSLSQEDRRYVVWEIVDGKRTGKYAATNQFIASRDNISQLLTRNEFQCLIDDCRDNDPPTVASDTSHLPKELAMRRATQVLNFGIEGGPHLLELSLERGANPVMILKQPIIPSPHPHALARRAGVADQDLRVEHTKENWEWMKSFIDVHFHVPAFHCPRNGAAAGYVSDDLAIFNGREITDRSDLLVFIQDKIEENLQKLVKKHYPHLPLISPSARPTWTDANGNHYLSGLHRPDVLTKLDLNKPKDFYFYQASQPGKHFEWGVDIVVCDDLFGAALAIGNETYV